jgi:hypothetical protein
MRVNASQRTEATACRGEATRQHIDADGKKYRSMFLFNRMTIILLGESR